MPNGSPDSPFIIDPSWKLAWPLVLNFRCDSDCEMAAFMKDVTPQLLALDPGDCFVFAPDRTKVFLRTERYGQPYITEYPFDPKKQLVPLEESKGSPELHSRWRDFWKNFDWQRNLEDF